MKNVRLKIEKLWQHLKISDDEFLIVREDTEYSEDYIIATKVNNKIKLCKTIFKKGTRERQKNFLASLNNPFTLIQQRGKNGLHHIPDVEEWKKDEEIDY